MQARIAGKYTHDPEVAYVAPHVSEAPRLPGLDEPECVVEPLEHRVRVDVRPAVLHHHLKSPHDVALAPGRCGAEQRVAYATEEARHAAT
jgi:hypothetical protein